MQHEGRYHSFNQFLRRKFGEKVYRVGLCGGFTCPNRDGTAGTTGCSFCNPASSEPLNFSKGMTVTEQLEKGTSYITARHGAKRFIAYFQDYSTTYDSPEALARRYEEALAFPGIVGLALSTRPDCLPEPVLDLLATIQHKTFLWVELGVQTIHEETLQRINRCHGLVDIDEAITALHDRQIPVSAHVIAGLPGETKAQLLDTAAYLRNHAVEAVKLHNLHVVTNTPLARDYATGNYDVLALSDYVDLAVSFLEQLPSKVVIQRLTGEAPRRLTVAPTWSINKMAVLNAIKRALRERNTWQGKGLGEASPL